MKTKTKMAEGPKAADARPDERAREYRDIGLNLLMASPTNPRKTFPQGPLQELASSLKQHGVKQPLLVRPLPEYTLKTPDLLTKTYRVFQDETQIAEYDKEFQGKNALSNLAATRKHNGAKFEIVCGERRFRAAGLARLETVPCVVERLSDLEVRQIQLVENLQREDLNPIEEAQGYADLMKQHNWTVADIQNHLQKSRSHVFAKLALLKTAPAVRAAMESGKISASVGELIGRIPGEKLQEKALKMIVDEGKGYNDLGGQAYDPISYRQASALLQEEFTVNLQKAPFNQKAEYPGAPHPGPCVTCPKRTGTAPEEYPDIKSPDVCTDPDCYKKKHDLHVAAELQKFAASGLEVLPASETKGLFRYGYLHSAAFLEEDCSTASQFKKKLKGKMPKPVVVPDDRGQPVKLYRKADVVKSAKEAGVQLELGGRQGESPAEKAKREREEKTRGETNTRCLKAATELIAGGKKQEEALRWVISEQRWDVDPGDALERGFGLGKSRAASALKMPMAKMIAVVAASCCIDYDGDAQDDSKELAKAVGIDVNKIQKEVLKDFNTAQELGLKRKLRSDGYRINKHGVIENPERIIIPDLPKGMRAVIEIGCSKGNWSVGTNLENGSGSSSSSPPKSTRYKTPDGAIIEGILQARRYLKTPGAVEALNNFEANYHNQFDLGQVALEPAKGGKK